MVGQHEVGQNGWIKVFDVEPRFPGRLGLPCKGDSFGFSSQDEWTVVPFTEEWNQAMESTVLSGYPHFKILAYEYMTWGEE